MPNVNEASLPRARAPKPKKLPAKDFLKLLGQKLDLATRLKNGRYNLTVVTGDAAGSRFTLVRRRGTWWGSTPSAFYRYDDLVTWEFIEGA